MSSTLAIGLGRRGCWRSAVRTLIVTHAPDATVSSVGVTIIKHGLQTGWSLEVMLEDILQLGALHSLGDEEGDAFSFELAYLSDNDILTSIVSVGNSLGGEFVGGGSREVVNGCADCFGIGPIDNTHESIEPSLRWLLDKKEIREIQFDVVQPKPGHQAVLLTGNQSSHLDLSSPKVQANIRAVKSLLELALVVAIREPQNSIDVNQQSKLWSE